MPFREYTIKLEKDGYRTVTRVIKTDKPAFTTFSRITFFAGLTFMGAAFFTTNSLKSLAYGMLSIPFFVLSLNLPPRIHFLLPRKDDGSTHLTSIPKTNFKFSSEYFPPEKKFTANYITRKFVDSDGNTARVIIARRDFLVSASALLDTDRGDYRQRISVGYIPPDTNISLSLSLYSIDMKPGGGGGKLQYIIPLWNGDIYQSLQIRVGPEITDVDDEISLQLSTDVDYRFTSTTFIDISLTPGYNLKTGKTHILTGIGIGFFL